MVERSWNLTASSMRSLGLLVPVVAASLGVGAAVAQGTGEPLRLEHFCAAAGDCGRIHQELREEASRFGFAVGLQYADVSEVSVQELELNELPAIAIYRGETHLGTIRGYRSRDALGEQLRALAYALAIGSLPSRSELLAATGEAVPEEGRVLAVDVEYDSGTLSVTAMRYMAGAPPKSNGGGQDDYVVQLVDRQGRVLFARGWTPVRHVVAPPPRPGDAPSHSFIKKQLRTVLVLPYFPSAAELRIWESYGVEALRAAVPEGQSVGDPVNGATRTPDLLFGGGNDRKRMVVLVLGDRYAAGQRGRFLEDAAVHVGLLVTTPPVIDKRRKLKIYAGDKINDLKCKHNCGGIRRLICCDSSLVLEAAAASGLSFDEIIVLVNRKRYGGSGGITVGGGGPESYATAYSAWKRRRDRGPQVTVHEFGHSAFGLMDEYEYYQDGVPYGPNCSTFPCRWSRPGLGCFPGCSYDGLNRPTENSCLMRTLRPPDGFHYCPVCSNRVRSVLKRLAR